MMAAVCARATKPVRGVWVDCRGSCRGAVLRVDEAQVRVDASRSEQAARRS
jgi:hypothetical protein